MTEYDKTAIRALYFKEYGQLSAFKEMIKYVEELADAGFALMLHNVLDDLTIQDDKGNWLLKSGIEHELQLKLMRYVLKKSKEVPF
ncbi:hypothetical protein [Sporosarcina sp. PTS2304]|uniref:hypothetical protein n=1 Tax=Sporosarcina sp. PTS2304 TaxID=2283194 RepID=UPI0013B449DD|nr:hypothetical protein [Sporosarcina sp. PTS2304]